MPSISSPRAASTRLNLIAGDALLSHVRDGLNDMDVRMFRDDLLDTVVPFLRVNIRDRFENIQDIPFVAQKLDEIFTGPHGSGLDIGRDSKTGRRRQVRLSAKSDDENAPRLFSD